LDNQEKLRHLRIDQYGQARDYTSPREGRDNFKMPARERQAHGADLSQQLESLDDGIRQRAAEQATRGTVLALSGAPGYELRLKSLDSVRAGIELLSVKPVGSKMVATVFVPQGKLTHFKGLVDGYLNKETTGGNPKNKKLVESISDISLAAIEHFWTDHEPFPAMDATISWEVWLRSGEGVAGALELFRAEATAAGLAVGARSLSFPDRIVVLAYGTANQFASSLTLLDILAELRRAKECPTSFVDLPATQQVEWVESFLSRVQSPPPECPAVCILDSGVYYTHPLLAIATEEKDVVTCFPPASPVDHGGHGTEMAGLVLYGDLMDVISSQAPLTLTHRLESVQVLPHVGANHQDIWGSITLEAVSRAVVASPDRKRIVCMAVASIDTRDKGEPSSWSAAIDGIAFGQDEAPPTLFVICAGNTDIDGRVQYPRSNYEVEGIHDPGQSWNALTVGAFTEKAFPLPATFDGYQPLAPKGGLSPCSSTSCMWDNKWPFKPDLVLEGGNNVLSPNKDYVDWPEPYSMLTTRRMIDGKFFSLMRDTSAATALAAKMAAGIAAVYPEYWPETIRALLVHSAEWTDAMMASFCQQTPKEACKRRLRCFGYGVPSLDKALWCAGNALTLISQAELQPYHKPGNEIKSKDMHLYALPWPVEALRTLHDKNVKMRITLSYFIEPSPGRRGWKYQHRYASHGLRFDVKKPTDTPEEFEARINKQARDEDDGEIDESDGRPWVLGAKLRNRGSLLCDWWEGTATDLADCGYIAIYPVIGWWRERKKLNRWANKVRYSLIVSLYTDTLDVDLHTPVKTMVEIPIET
jgi:hypothetical protein